MRSFYICIVATPLFTGRKRRRRRIQSYRWQGVRAGSDESDVQQRLNRELPKFHLAFQHVVPMPA